MVRHTPDRRIHSGRLSVLILLASVAVGCAPASRADRNTGSSDIASVEALQAARNSTANPVVRSMLMEAETWMGTTYRYGGTGRDGIDCSAFVREVVAVAGVHLPRRSVDQASEGAAVLRSSIRAGDLVFFNTNGSGVSHVGLAIDATRFVHASTSRGVIVSSLDDRYYADRFLFGRRIL